jgi:hypothetical protein
MAFTSTFTLQVSAMFLLLISSTRMSWCRSGLVLAIHLKRPYAFDKKNKSTCMGEEIMMM